MIKGTQHQPYISNPKSGKTLDSPPRQRTSSHAIYYRILVLIILVVASLVFSGFLTKSFLLPSQLHYSGVRKTVNDSGAMPVEKWGWIEAHRDCPIIGIGEIRRTFPKGSSDSTREALSLVIAVMSSSAKKERMIALMQGWASSVKNVFRSVDLYFSLDRHVPEIPTDLTWIAPDERAHPPTREGAQWRSLLSINESIHRAPSADWILLVDDDTFVNTFELRDFLDSLNPSLPAIYGYMYLHPKWERNNCFMSGAAGILLQRQAAVRVIPHLEQCFNRFNDVTISCSASRAGIPLVHSELFSPQDNSLYENHIHLYTMVTLHYVDPKSQVEMFADLSSHRLSSGFRENATLSQPFSQLMSNQGRASEQPSSHRVDWNDYRLGDGVKMYDKNGISNRSIVCKRWPSTLLCEYLKQTDKPNQVNVLAYIVNQRNTISDSKKDRPSLDTTVIHLRLGDGLCGMYDSGSFGGSRCKGAEVGSAHARIPSCWENDTDCFVNEHGAFYAYPKEYYEPVAAELLEKLGNATKIVVVADLYHWTRNKDPRNGDYSIDLAYRDNLISFLLSKGFKNIEIRNASNPDNDFLYMSSAKAFVQGGGGFSGLISSVVTANGGKVFQPRRTSSLYAKFTQL